MAHEHGPFLEQPSQSPPNHVWREIAHVVLAEWNEEGFSPSQCERDSKQGYGTRILAVRFGIYRTHVGDRDALMQFVELAAVQHSLIRFRRTYTIIRVLLRLIPRVGKG